MKIVRSLIRILLLLVVSFLFLVFVAPSIFPDISPDDRLGNFSPEKITDMHVHIAGLGYGDSGCFVGNSLASSFKKPVYLKAFNVSEEELKAFGDQILVKKVSNMVSESRFVESAVILAMDGYFEKTGAMNQDKTQIFVPNKYVLEETKKYSNLLYGASINPYRKDAIELLHEAKKDGAVLVKWIPSIMNIDPSDPILIPFYKTLTSLDLPLLTHAGQERSFAHADDTLGDPKRLELPLSLGVRIIAAHIATTGQIEEQEMIDRLLPLFSKYPNLFADFSSLTQINKLSYLDQGLLNINLHDRILYGSDWPLQFFPLVSPWYFPTRLSIRNMHYINSQNNSLDRDVLLKFALGVPERSFGNTKRILNINM